MNREAQLSELAEIITELEKKYQVGICSSNGCTSAVIVDQLTGKGYDYYSRKGTIIPSLDE